MCPMPYKFSNYIPPERPATCPAKATTENNKKRFQEQQICILNLLDDCPQNEQKAGSSYKGYPNTLLYMSGLLEKN